jgi:hypothetical protein
MLMKLIQSLKRLIKLLQMRIVIMTHWKNRASFRRNTKCYSNIIYEICKRSTFLEKFVATFWKCWSTSKKMDCFIKKIFMWIGFFLMWVVQIHNLLCCVAFWNLYKMYSTRMSRRYAWIVAEFYGLQEAKLIKAHWRQKQAHHKNETISSLS